MSFSGLGAAAAHQLSWPRIRRCSRVQPAKQQAHSGPSPFPEQITALPPPPRPRPHRSNDFGSQPEDAAAVKAACQKAGYTGRIMEFASVKGPTAHPLWVFLRVRRFLIGLWGRVVVGHREGGRHQQAVL